MELKVHVVRVFVDESDGHGNELGVVFDAAELPGELGPRLTAQLGFSETVFVDDTGGAAIRIFNQTAEMKLAGHPTVGTAWLLAQVTGKAPDVLRPRLAGELDTWTEDGLTWIRARGSEGPAWQFTQVESPAEVDAQDPTGYAHDIVWAWIDEQAGIVRARSFVSAVGVAEDEATGSAALLLAERLGRPITIRQGRGSVIKARPAAEPGWSEIGGRVASDGVSEVSL